MTILGSLEVDDFGLDFIIKNIALDVPNKTLWVMGDKKLGRLDLDMNCEVWSLILD